MSDPLTPDDLARMRAAAYSHLWATGLLGPDPTSDELAEMVVRLCDEVERLRAWATWHLASEGFYANEIAEMLGQSEAPSVSEGGKG